MMTNPDVCKRANTFPDYIYTLQLFHLEPRTGTDTLVCVKIIACPTHSASALTGSKLFSRSVLHYPFAQWKALMRGYPHSMPWLSPQ